MTYTIKALLMSTFLLVSVGTHEDITCDELMENIIYEGVFFGGLEKHTLASPFLSNVTAYIYNDDIYVISTDMRDQSSIYCSVDKDDWAAFEKSCNCSYSKKFDQYIRKYGCDCIVE